MRGSLVKHKKIKKGMIRKKGGRVAIGGQIGGRINRGMCLLLYPPRHVCRLKKKEEEEHLLVHARAKERKREEKKRGRKKGEVVSTKRKKKEMCLKLKPSNLLTNHLN